MTSKKDNDLKTKLDLGNGDKVELKSFDGTNQKCVAFLNLFRFYGRSAGWADDVMAGKLMRCLHGPAFELAQTQGVTVVENGASRTTFTYRVLVDALLDKFCQPNYGMLLHNQVRLARIGPNQTIQQFAAYLTKLNTEIGHLVLFEKTTPVADIVLRDVFVNNLSSDILSRLMLDLPDTFKKTRDVAFHIDNANSYASKLGSSGNKDNYKKHAKSNAAHGAKTEIFKKNDQKRPNSTKFEKEITCNYCKESNHTEATC